MNRFIPALALLAVASAFGQTTEPSRQDTVRQRGADVVPFDMNATTHVFSKTPTGGVQRVVLKTPGDAGQTALIRGHLKDLADEFARGDFSAPASVHGADMPGLSALQSAAPGALQVRYRELPSGAEIRFSSGDPKLVAAVHAWFDAQLADHGKDAMEGHDRASMN
jgi:hypothetical protein